MRRDIYHNNFRKLSYIAVGLITLSVLAIVLTVWSLRSDAIKDAETDTSNIATVLSEQFARSIQSIDIVLTDISEQSEAQSPLTQNEFDKRIPSHDFYEFLKERLGRLSQADFIGINDNNGQVSITTLQWPTPKLDVTDREYFQHFKNNNDPGIYISGPLTNRISGAPTIIFSRRINDPNNKFLGVVLVGIRLSYFEGIYSSITRLHDQSFLLLHRDGRIILRYPDTVDRSNEQMPEGSPWYRLVAQGGGQYR